VSAAGTATLVNAVADSVHRSRPSQHFVVGGPAARSLRPQQGSQKLEGGIGRAGFCGHCASSFCLSKGSLAYSTCPDQISPIEVWSASSLLLRGPRSVTRSCGQRGARRPCEDGAHLDAGVQAPPIVSGAKPLQFGPRVGWNNTKPPRRGGSRYSCLRSRAGRPSHASDVALGISLVTWFYSMDYASRHALFTTSRH
jgi:hypothetical protein